MRFGINRRLIRQVLVGIGFAGILVIGYGIFSVFDTVQKYNDLALIPPPIDLQNASDADKITFAQIELGKRDLLRRREEAKSVIGIGATLLGAAVLLYLQVPASQGSQPVAGAPSDQR